MGKLGRVTLLTAALLSVILLVAGGLKVIQLSTEIRDRVSIPIFLSHPSDELMVELQSMQGVERVIEHDREQIKALYKDLVGLEWEESFPDVVEVFVQPEQAQQVYNRLVKHSDVQFAAFDGEMVDLFVRWGAVFQYTGIVLLGMSGIFGIAIYQWVRPIGVLASCLLCLILWGGVLNPAAAEAGYMTELRREVLDLRNVVDEFEMELDSLQRDMTNMEQQAAEDQSKLEKQRVQIHSLQQEKVELEQEGNTVSITLAELEIQRDELTAVSSEKQSRLEKVVNADLEQSVLPKVNTRALDRAVVRYALLRETQITEAVEAERRGVMKELKAWQERQAALDKRYDDVIHELVVLQDEAASLENVLTDNQEKLVQNRRKQQELIRNMLTYNDALQMKERVLGQSLVGSAFPDASGKSLGWPLPVSGTLTSDYGLRVHPIFGDERVHTGIDLACEMGTPILAAADGVITYNGEFGGYGLAVIVDHYQGMSTLYAHASELVGEVGQRVKKGDVVALVGSTGLSTGPHLHFEVREEDSHVDPWVWLE